MSNQCRCPSSRLFPHRADKCTFATKSTKRAARTDSPFAPPVPPPSGNVASQNVSDDQTPLSTVQVDTDVVGSRTEISPPTAEIVPPAVVATSANELSAAQEVVASNSSLPNGNERCDCMAYRFKKHRKKMCSWKKHVAIGLATATIVAGTVVLATVVAEEAEKDSAKDGMSGKEVCSKKMTSEQKGAAAGLAIASVIAGTAALATVVVCDMQDSKKSDDSTISLSNGVDNAHSNVGAETGDRNVTGTSHAETQQHEPEPEEEPESEVEEEEESEEDFEARMIAQGRADLYAALRDAREAEAAILRAERQEAQRLQREQCELQQLAV